MHKNWENTALLLFFHLYNLHVFICTELESTEWYKEPGGKKTTEPIIQAIEVPITIFWQTSSQSFFLNISCNYYIAWILLHTALFHLDIFSIGFKQPCICVLYFSSFSRNSFICQKGNQKLKFIVTVLFCGFESLGSVLWRLFWNYFTAKSCMYFLLSVYLDPETPLKSCLAISCPTQPTSIHVDICIWNKMHIESAHFKRENYTDVKINFYYIK